MLKTILKRWKFILIILPVIVLAYLIIRPKFLPKPKFNIQDSTQVKKGDLKQTLTISGEIDAEEKVTLKFQTSGRLAWVGVQEGDYVKKYQAIAALDRRELEKELKKDLLAYMDERWDFEQTMRDDYKDKVLTDTIKRIKEKSQFDLNSTVLDVEIQNIALEYANLWTPIAGIVTRIVAPYAGVNITPATAEFDVVNPDTIFFSALADETEVIKLQEGLSGELLLDAFPENELIGTVKNISFIPKTGESGTVYQVKFVFINDNSQFLYRLGMVGDLTFTTEQKYGVLYLPTKYVVTQNGKKYAYLKKDKEVVKTEVITGMETEDEIEITRGVNNADTVYLPQ